jgi:hypothetical protein
MNCNSEARLLDVFVVVTCMVCRPERTWSYDARVVACALCCADDVRRMYVCMYAAVENGNVQGMKVL